MMIEAPAEIRTIDEAYATVERFRKRSVRVSFQGRESATVSGILTAVDLSPPVPEQMATLDGVIGPEDGRCLTIVVNPAHDEPHDFWIYEAGFEAGLSYEGTVRLLNHGRGALRVVDQGPRAGG